MDVVLKRLAAPKLARVGVADAERICGEVSAALAAANLPSPMLDAPEDVFGRLGRR